MSEGLLLITLTIIRYNQDILKHQILFFPWFNALKQFFNLSTGILGQKSLVVGAVLCTADV